jgi:hypothetical protein
VRIPDILLARCELRQLTVVGAHAFNVLRTLFHSPNNTNTPGEIIWTYILHAVFSAEFSVGKLGSPAWSFMPKTANVSVERSTQFHEPHPLSKIPFVIARRHGRLGEGIWLG